MSALLKDQDRAQLRRTLELAARGQGRVSPNPLVGAVITRGDQVIGEGFHAELGGLHAERAALSDCRARGEDPAGATLYVTLEPCAHSGRQPPCVHAILESGLARVVYASDDPSEKARGRGPGVLRDGGVEVVSAAGAEAAAARLLNQAFRKHARTDRPLVWLKMAASLDGFVAAPSGDSRWISGEASRAMVHGWRAEVDAVAVGIGTAERDDPLLTAREGDVARQPTRVIFDSTARLSPRAKVLLSADQSAVILVASAAAAPERLSALKSAGATPVIVSGDDSRARVVSALEELGRRQITSLLLEGGPRLAGAFAGAGEIDELRLFIAPLVLGGGRSVLEGAAVSAVREAERALFVSSERVGEDVLICARLREW